MSSAHKVNVNQCRNKKSKASLAAVAAAAAEETTRPPIEAGRKGEKRNIELLLPDVRRREVDAAEDQSLSSSGCRPTFKTQSGGEKNEKTEKRRNS